MVAAGGAGGSLPGDEIEVRIDSLAQGGEGVARPPGAPVVFVAGGVPGDRARVRVVQARGRFLRAEIVELVEAGPGRRPPPCPELPACGGCDLQHVGEDVQAGAAAESLRQALRRVGGFPHAEVDAAVVPASTPVPALGYRQRARFHVGLSGRPPFMGFHARGSHEVHGIAACLVLEPELDALRARIAQALPAVAAALPQARLPADLHVDLPAPGAGTALLDLDHADRAGESQLAAAARELAAASPALRAAEVRRGRLRAARGEEAVPFRRGTLEEPERFPAWHSPGGFLQASRAGGLALASRVLEGAVPWLRPGVAVLELHAGSGAFTLPLAAAGARVTAVERDARALANLGRAATEAGLEVERVGGDDAAVLQRLLAEGRRFELVVLDPPRTGAGAVAALIAATGAAAVVHVSCDAATLARDLRTLARADYRLVRAEPLLLFPQTSHYEVVAVLERV